MDKERINKFIANNSNYSRREVDLLIKNGKIIVDGMHAVLGQCVSGKEKIEIRGEILNKKRDKVLIAYNKPVGVICTTDRNKKDNIVEKVNYKWRVYPVGRLDVNTSGLILLTNNSKLKRLFEDPKNGKEKEYIVIADKTIKDKDKDKLKTGVNIGGYITKKAKVFKINNKTIRVIITEGKNRQIRRMFNKLGYTVLKLHRIRIDSIKLGDIKSGEWKEIKQSEMILDTKVK